MSEMAFRKCERASVTEFIEYDRDVDIVTCWEAFTNEQFAYHFPTFHFDRFPSSGTNSPEWTAPNFTVLFDERYGIAFETYHDISDDDYFFEQEIEQLKTLDTDLEFQCRDGRRIVPDTYDITLLVTAEQSQTLGHRIEEKLSEGDLELDSNLVLMEFDYIDQDEQPKYRFKRLSHPDQNFQDEILPDRYQLSSKLSIEGGTFENLRIPIDDYFSELKATGVLTNTMPSELYLACYLWNDVFYKLLEEDEKQKWQKGDPKKTIPVTVEVSELCQKLNRKFIPQANIQEEWVTDALEYIAIAKLAKQADETKFKVEFRNLHEKRRKYKDVTSERSEVADLAYLFANWHCETQAEHSAKEIADMITAESVDKADLSGLAKAELGDF